MEYSASMVSCLFWLAEMRKTAGFMMSGLGKEEIKKIALSENIYQVKASDRAIRILGVTYKRLESLPKVLVQSMATADIATAKQLVLISIMKTDRLFFEFVYEVYRERILLGENVLPDRDINRFFDDKLMQSNIVAGFSESAIQKLKQCFSRMLFEAGLISVAAGTRTITPVLLDYKIRKQLEDNGMSSFIHAITGEN
jgi:hypothetical protein